MRTFLLAGLFAGALIFPSSAAAQTTNCTTYHWSSYDDTSCYTSPGYSSSYSSSSYSDALVQLYLLQAQEQYLATLQAQQQAYWAQQQAIQAAQARLAAWSSKGVHPGGFVKAADALAIYALDNAGQLRAFGSWDQFQRFGGHTDLSNVMVFTTFAPLTADWFGNPLTG